MKILSALFILFVLGCGSDPPPSTIISAGSDIGEKCNIDASCDGLCIPDGFGWPGGYCTRECESDDDCGEAACVGFLTGDKRCFAQCEDSENCREGYVCDTFSGRSICTAQTERGPQRGELGAWCYSDKTCEDGFDCGRDTAIDVCTSDCASCDGVCDDGICAASCVSTFDCAVGLDCVGTPKRCEVDSKPGVSFDVTKSVLGAVCEPKNDDGKYTVQFSLAGDSSRFSISMWTTKGTLLPTELRIDGTPFQIKEINKTQNLRIEELEQFPTPVGVNQEVAFDWTLIFPYDTPSAAYVIAGGSYELDIVSNDSPPCWYILEDSQPGVRLDVNYRFVGTGALDSTSVLADQDFVEMHERFVELMQSAGITVDAVRYSDAPASLAERYSIIRDFSDVEVLTGWARGVDETLEGHLSVDVFLVAGFSFGVLGISPSLPGAPGNHGSPSQGLVFSVADLGFDNKLVGHVLAHEMGHFLGLRHTTEVVVGTEEESLFDELGVNDPYSDTAMCTNVLKELTKCPDFENLMFPLAPPSSADSEGGVSDQQGTAMKNHLVVKSGLGTLSP